MDSSAGRRISEIGSVSLSSVTLSEIGSRVSITSISLEGRSPSWDHIQDHRTTVEGNDDGGREDRNGSGNKDWSKR